LRAIALPVGPPEPLAVSITAIKPRYFGYDFKKNKMSYCIYRSDF